MQRSSGQLAVSNMQPATVESDRQLAVQNPLTLHFVPQGHGGGCSFLVSFYFRFMICFLLALMGSLESLSTSLPCFSQVAVASCLSCVVFWTRMLDFSSRREILRRGGWLRAFSARSVPHAQGDRPRAMFANCNKIVDTIARLVCLPARVGLESMSEE